MKSINVKYIIFVKLALVDYTSEPGYVKLSLFYFESVHNKERSWMSLLEPGTLGMLLYVQSILEHKTVFKILLALEVGYVRSRF